MPDSTLGIHLPVCLCPYVYARCPVWLCRGRLWVRRCVGAWGRLSRPVCSAYAHELSRLGVDGRVWDKMALLLIAGSAAALSAGAACRFLTTPLCSRSLEAASP